MPRTSPCHERDPRLANLLMAVALAVIAGWLLVIGKGLLLPVFAAVVAVYVLTTAAEALGHQPVVGRLPAVWRHILVLVVFTLCIVGLGYVVASTVDELLTQLPTYRANLEAITSRIATMIGYEAHPSWEEIRNATIAKIDMGKLLTLLLTSVTRTGGTIFLIAVYAGFLMVERFSFPAKLAAALPKGDQAERTAQIIADINRRIGNYLAVKTLINAILGVISFVILFAMDVDFALFWAVLIALFNYIPYVGGFIGVALPVVLSLAQFGSLSTTLILTGLLVSAQVYVGNILEPRLFARQLNLSPFVILVALSLWTALWGFPGAILAVPMTAMLAIVFNAFPETRFIAILLANRVEPEEPPAAKASPRAAGPSPP